MRIEDHAVLGDCHTAALVGRNGLGVGLFAEEYSLGDRRMLGNFPQAFSHVALINTALNLAQEEARLDARKPARKKIARRQDPRHRHRRHRA